MATTAQIFPVVTARKGISSMRLAKEIGVQQKDENDHSNQSRPHLCCRARLNRGNARRRFYRILLRKAIPAPVKDQRNDDNEDRSGE
jgi:hypothetical protein